MSTTVATHAPAPAHESDEEVARGFGKAIIIGAVLGILVFTAMIAIAAKALDPELSNQGVAAVAVWTGLWGGLFLGGTVTVGLWSQKHFH